MNAPVVVVGASVAGVRTALTLRAKGFIEPILLLSDEAVEPYDKPPLSKQFLAGTADASSMTLLTLEQAAEKSIDLRLNSRALALDTANHQIRTSAGLITYSRLVVACGASARPAPWTAESGMHVIRTLSDSTALRRELESGARIVVIGGGFIGAEAAATARHLGCQVTVVDPSPSPMSRTLGSDLGAVASDIHARHGVATRFGTGVESVTGVRGDLTVTLTDGSQLAADTVVVGIGAAPNVAWLKGSGLTIDNGVVCDEYCRAVGVEDVFAAGDVARWQHKTRDQWVRFEHWTNAIDQAACVAHNISNPDQLKHYAPQEYVWSDQYGWKIQVCGAPDRAVRTLVLGDTDGPKPRVAALHSDSHGVLVAATTVNWPKALITCRRLLDSPTPTAEVAAQLNVSK